MAKQFGYRPYKTRKDGDKRVRYVVIAVVVAAAALLAAWSHYRQLRTVSNESAGEPAVVLKDISPRTVEIPLPKPEPVKAVSEPKPAESPRPVEPVVGLPISPVPVAQALPAPSAVKEAPIQVPPVQAAVKESPIQVPPAPSAVDVVSAADRTALEAAELLGKAIADKSAGRIIEARNRLNKSLDLRLSQAVVTEVKKQLAGLSAQWLFSRDVLVGDTLSGLYEIQPGEKLSLIAKRHKVPYEMLQKLNNISRPELLQAGSKIKILYGPFNAVIRRSTFTMDLYLQGTFVKSYKVGLGRDKYQTPTGKWLVASGGKLIKPTWTDPDTGRRYIADDPDYPLGSRWISLEGLEGAAKGRTGFAIHGTKDPQTIGTQSSRGCIRLFNGDAIEVYDLFEPGFSEVLIVE